MDMYVDVHRLEQPVNRARRDGDLNRPHAGNDTVKLARGDARVRT